MVRAIILALAGATTLLSTAAAAADLPPPLPPPPLVQPVPMVVGGWYLRGDIGIAQKFFSDFSHTQTNPAFVWPASWRIDQKDMADGGFIGFGIGYAWNNWLRFDITGEYRMKEAFHVVGSYTEFCPNGTRCFDVYNGQHSGWLVLANAYVDLGTWWCLTPFVGAGIGTASHRFTGVTDVGLLDNGASAFGFASSDSTKWNMAWALHAGVAYNVSNTFKVELAYRYVNFGSIDTPVIDCASTGCATAGPRAFYSFTNFYTQDIKIGMRWLLQPEAPAYLPPPVMRKG